MSGDAHERLKACRAAFVGALFAGEVDALDGVMRDGLRVKPLYTAAKPEGLPYSQALSALEPCVRGPRATTYAASPWTTAGLVQAPAKVIVALSIA